MSSYSWFCGNSCVYNSKKKKEQKFKFIHSHHPHFPRPFIHLTFSFSKYHLFVAKHASILSTHFFMAVSNSSFGICSKIVWVSWITWASFKVPAAHFTFQCWKQPEIRWRKVWVVRWIFHHFNIAVLISDSNHSDFYDQAIIQNRGRLLSQRPTYSPGAYQFGTQNAQRSIRRSTLCGVQRTTVLRHRSPTTSRNSI